MSESNVDPDSAEQYVANARSLLADFENEDVTVEEQHGMLQHAVNELENAQRSLTDDY